MKYKKFKSDLGHCIQYETMPSEIPKQNSYVNIAYKCIPTLNEIEVLLQHLSDICMSALKIMLSTHRLT